MHDAPIQDRYDCVVIGVDSGGSAMAALSAEAGYSVLLAECEAMPRFHVKAIIFEPAVR